MYQSFGEAYASVVDYNAKGDGITDDTAAIQAAIDSRRHVVLTQGAYLFSTSVDALGNTIPLTFGNDEQRCDFLAGAVLKPKDGDAYVLISGQKQRITGLRVEADDGILSHSPLVEIYGAFDLWLQELRVSARSIGVSPQGVSAAVRVMYLTKCNFIGGRVAGGQAPGSVGIWLASSYDYDHDNNPNPTPGRGASDRAAAARSAAATSSGAYEVGAVGLTVESFGWAVRIACITVDPSFVNCRFADNVDGALVLVDDGDVVAASGAADAVTTSTKVIGFNLISCRFEGARPPQYVQVDAGCSWQGGVVLGCTFDEVGLAGVVPGQKVGWPTGGATFAAPQLRPNTSGANRSGVGRTLSLPGSPGGQLAAAGTVQQTLVGDAVAGTDPPIRPGVQGSIQTSIEEHPLRKLARDPLAFVVLPSPNSSSGALRKSCPYSGIGSFAFADLPLTCR